MVYHMTTSKIMPTPEENLKSYHQRLQLPEKKKISSWL
jgi:hypothetical protein